MRIIGIVFFLVVILCNMSNAQGIQFFHGTYEEAKAKAKKERKQIFVDVYTSWCGPCKKMAAEVFPRQDVGDFFNKNFVSLKLDAEKEASHGFFRQYKAGSYPSYFWLDADGLLLDQKVGSCAPDVFIAMAQKAMTGSLAVQQAELKKRWDSGERNLELVNQYVLGVLWQNHPEQVRPAIIEFLNGLSESELKSYPVYNLIKSNIGTPRGGLVNDKVMELFLKYYDYYEQNYTNKYDTGIQGFYTVLYRYLVRMNSAPFLGKRDIAIVDKQFEQQLEKNRSYHLKYEEIYTDCAKAERLLYIGEYTQGIDAVATVLKKYGADNPYLYEQLLYSIALSKYLVSGDKTNIGKVMEIAKDALRIIPNKAAVTYYAAVQIANDNYPEAISALANKHFYSGADVSNAAHPFLSFGNLRKEFPEKSLPEVVIPR